MLYLVPYNLLFVGLPSGQYIVLLLCFDDHTEFNSINQRSVNFFLNGSERI